MAFCLPSNDTPSLAHSSVHDTPSPEVFVLQRCKDVMQLLYGLAPIQPLRARAKLFIYWHCARTGTCFVTREIVDDEVREFAFRDATLTHDVLAG